MKKHIEPVFDFSLLPDSEAAEVLKENQIALAPSEARYFQEKMGRPLTLTELVILGIQGSEHCAYRSTRMHLKKLPTKGAKVIMGPGEDSGIVEIAKEKSGKRWGLVISHESHNHPSQIVPYEGAATGIGGIVRDILCMGARVIGVLDCLRFGNVETHLSRWLTREVVEGISGYGNPLGVPNLGGDLEYDPSFDSNCLVNVISIGILREDEIIHSFVPEEAEKEGYDIIIVGKPTDRSGFGGASFASADLKEEDAEANKGAVQEPNPFLERHLLVSTYDLFAELKKRKLLDRVSFKDMGAGGNVCASVEQIDSRGFGAEMDLDQIHLGEEGLPPHIISCAETQERFCWMCHPTITQLILDTYNKKWALPKVSQGAEARVVGKVKPGNYVLNFGGSKVVDAPAKLLTEGLLYQREFKAKTKSFVKDKVDFGKINPDQILRKLLQSENIACRAPIYEKYDRQVQGGTVHDTGRGTSAVIQPLVNTKAPENFKKIGVTIGTGGSGTLGRHSAELQAAHSVCEAIANVVTVGAEPLALTDCLNYGNPEHADQMAEFVEGIDGLVAAANAFGTPFVSGNVSLYNNNGVDSINPSAIVTCVGKLKDAHDVISARFQQADNLIVLVGERSNELGSSEFEKIIGKSLGKPFSLDVESFANESKFVLKAKKLIASARDLHRGGLSVAVAEQSFGSGLGFELKKMPIPKLFSENPGFILEVDPKKLDQLKKLAAKHKVKITKVGEVNDKADQKLEKVWTEGLRETLRS